MGAIVLCEFPSGKSYVRSWILDRVTLLTARCEAELEFVGTETATDGTPITEMIAVGFDSAERANSAMSEWRRETALPAFVELRLLRIEPVQRTGFSAAMFS